MNFIERFILRKELTSMLTNILTHWKTTASGVALAILQVVLDNRSPKQLAVALATAVILAISKDPGDKSAPTLVKEKP